MIIETGRVLSVAPNGLWVETLQRSACGSCQAQKGCGHSALAKLGESASSVWVLLDGKPSSHFKIGDQVQIGIPDNLLVTGALVVYMVPLLALIMATFIAQYFALRDALVALSALIGLLLGGSLVRYYSYIKRFDPRLQPVLVDGASPSCRQVIETETLVGH